MPKVNFLNEKKEVEAKEGDNLREIAIAEGIELYPGIAKYVNCRGKNACGTCKVRITGDTLKHASPMSFPEKARLALMWSAIGEDELRLSCQVKILGDLNVETQPSMNLYGKPV